jgi:hypothetical protein
LSVIADDAAQADLRVDVDELFQEGARRMLAVALEAEVAAYIAAHATLTDERGHRLVRRDGHAPARTIAAGVGQVEVVARAWTTGGSTRRPGSGSSSGA